jgi:type III secretory pathway component EscR
MTINEIKQALRKGLIIISVYILVSLIMGAVLVAQGWAPFGMGFVLTALSGGALYWLVKYSD